MTTIKQNLEAAIAAIEATPDRDIDLAYFRSPCGTHHCSLGLLTTVPHFIEQGLCIAPMPGFPTKLMVFNSDRPARPGPYGLAVQPWLEEMFGEEAYARLFIERGESPFDTTDDDLYGLTDKELALSRLRRQLVELA